MSENELGSEENVDNLDCEATRAAAADWAEWAKHDLHFFVGPIVEATGMTRTEVLLYLVHERLAQLVEQGVTVQVVARHDVHQHPPEDEQEDWKQK